MVMSLPLVLMIAPPFWMFAALKPCMKVVVLPVATSVPPLKLNEPLAPPPVFEMDGVVSVPPFRL